MSPEVVGVKVRGFGNPTPKLGKTTFPGDSPCTFIRRPGVDIMSEF